MLADSSSYSLSGQRRPGRGELYQWWQKHGATSLFICHPPKDRELRWWGEWNLPLMNPPPRQWSTSSLGRPPFLKTPQAPQMAPLTRVQIRDPFTQKPQPRLLLSAGTDGAEALLLVDFPISETDTSRSTGWGVWVWKMTKIGAWQERGLYLITVKWFDNCREHWKIPGYTLIFGMFSSTQTPHTPSKEVL